MSQGAISKLDPAVEFSVCFTMVTEYRNVCSFDFVQPFRSSVVAKPCKSALPGQIDSCALRRFIADHS